VREREEGHLEADEQVCECQRDLVLVLVAGVWAEVGDDTGRDEDGDEERLPEGEEQDTLDAKEFGDRTGWPSV
jgi:hypothetical protein